MALLVMFNNLFHDLSTGVWFSSMLLTVLLGKWVKRESSPAVEQFYRSKLPALLNVNLISLAFVFFFGVFRALAYYQYEFLPSVGNGQVVVLIIKHIFLIAAAGWGLYWQLKLRKQSKLRKTGSQNWGGANCV